MATLALYAELQLPLTCMASCQPQSSDLNPTSLVLTLTQTIKPERPDGRA